METMKVHSLLVVGNLPQCAHIYQVKYADSPSQSFCPISKYQEGLRTCVRDSR